MNWNVCLSSLVSNMQSLGQQISFNITRRGTGTCVAAAVSGELGSLVQLYKLQIQREIAVHRGRR